MNSAPPRRHCCAFCGTGHEAAELLFVSWIGGLPAAICSGCVVGFAAILDAYRCDPEQAAALIEKLSL